MSHSPQLESDLSQFAQYRVSDPVQIQLVLRDLSKREALLALFPRSANTICHLSRVRSCSQTGIDLVVEEPALREPRIFASPDTTAVAFLDQFKVQFPLDSPIQPSLQGENVLHISRPTVLYRIQRREGFRVKPQPSQSALCNVRLAASRVVPWPILDLSVVGVALALPADASPPRIGTVWRFCVLQIDRLAPVPVDLIVTAVSAPPDIRIGCAFDLVPNEVERLLQRTVIELERTGIQARRAASTV